MSGRGSIGRGRGNPKSSATINPPSDEVKCLTISKVTKATSSVNKKSEEQFADVEELQTGELLISGDAQTSKSEHFTKNLDEPIGQLANTEWTQDAQDKFVSHHFNGGHSENIDNCTSYRELISRVMLVKSPDDLQVHDLAAQAESIFSTQSELGMFIKELCVAAIDNRSRCPVAARLFGLLGGLQIGNIKVRLALMTHLQEKYDAREAIMASNWEKFVSVTHFIGELFFYMKTPAGGQYKVLIIPMITCLKMVLNAHVNEEDPHINDDMLVVSKLLLQSGKALHKIMPEDILALIKLITEVMCRRNLSSSCRVNLLAALAELWPMLPNPRMHHALLASKMGLSLHV